MSLFFAFLLVLISVLPDTVWPASAREVNLALRHQVPQLVGGDTGFLLGTDHLGRDIFYRILTSTRLTLLIAGGATLFAMVTGTFAGLMAGYFSGRVDLVISQVVDLLLAFPVLLLVLALVATLGRTLSSLVLVLGLSGWADYTRVIRGVVLAVKEREFIESARAVGSGPVRILWRHLLPNIVSPILVLSSLSLAQFILTESAISFLGMGPAPPDVTWGGMVGEGRNYIYAAWWSSLIPGAAILLTVLCLNFLGDAIRDAFDPFAVRGLQGMK